MYAITHSLTHSLGFSFPENFLEKRNVFIDVQDTRVDALDNSLSAQDEKQREEEMMNKISTLGRLKNLKDSVPRLFYIPDINNQDQIFYVSKADGEIYQHNFDGTDAVAIHSKSNNTIGKIKISKIHVDNFYSTSDRKVDRIQHKNGNFYDLKRVGENGIKLERSKNQRNVGLELEEFFKDYRSSYDNTPLVTNEGNNKISVGGVGSFQYINGQIERLYFSGEPVMTISEFKKFITHSIRIFNEDVEDVDPFLNGTSAQRKSSLEDQAYLDKINKEAEIKVNNKRFSLLNKMFSQVTAVFDSSDIDTIPIKKQTQILYGFYNQIKDVVDKKMYNSNHLASIEKMQAFAINKLEEIRSGLEK